MLRLDAGTLAFSAAIASLASALVIVAYGDFHVRKRSWEVFAASAALYGIGVLVIIFRGAMPAMPATMIGSLLVMASAIAAHAGLCLLLGRPGNPGLYASLAAAALIGEYYFLAAEDSINARVAVISLARAPLFAHAAVILHSSRRTERSDGSLLLEWVFGAWAALLLVRGVGTVVAQGPIHDLIDLAGIPAMYFGAPALGYVAIAIALLRREAGQMTRALAARVAQQTEALERQVRQHAAARRAIKTQLAFQDALFDTVPNPVFVKDAAGAYLTCNRAFERHFGVTRKQLVGQSAFQICPPDRAAVHAAADQRLLAGGEPETYRIEALFADGSIHQMLCGKAGYRDADGNVVGLVGTMTDITDQLRVAENLARSEADLRAILDNMTDIFYRNDTTGRLLMASRSAEKLLGYTVDEVLGRCTVEFFYDPDGREALLAAIQAGGGSISDSEFRMRHKDGHPVWVAISAHVRYDDQGHPAGTEGIIRLIEERKRFETNLRESQALIRALLNASADAIMLLPVDGTLLAVNAVLAARFGRTAEELTGTCLWDLFPPEVAAGRKAALVEVLETGIPFHYIDRRGDLHYDNHIYPVAGADGITDKAAVYSRDITDQKKAEARIASTIDEIERSNSELEQFAYVASHDLREPLRMISSYLSLLARRYGDRLDADGHEFLEYAREGALRMDQLVLDLLEFSRVDRLGSAMTRIAVLPAIRQAVRHLTPTIEESGAQVVVEETTPPPMVMGDATQITRLFQNLIGNAVKYRAAERVSEVRVSCVRHGGGWEFRVADNGIGIEDQYFERIFRIFQRLHTRNCYEGTGIGLAICKKIVERHGGQIRVESVPGRGSTFSFTLPAAAEA